jgi:hypothetical protein
MRVKSIFAALLVGTVLSACNNNPESQQKRNVAQVDKQESYSPIEGNWELVSNVVNGKLVNPKRTQQFKMFNDGFFSYIMYDSLGNFYGAGAGPYEVDGKTYKETFNYYSDTTYIGSADWQEWEIKGDTLLFYGFTKALMADGRDVTKDWGYLKFVEKRVKAKR